MRTISYIRSIPIILVTGFLGSGKTTLLKNLLQAAHGKGQKVAIIQNEFAQSSIDGETLRQEEGNFELKELNTGSIFCACLFSQFKQVVLELSADPSLSYIIVEATGIADPIAVAQLLEDQAISKRCYLSQIISVVDAPRFLNVLSRITGVKHQIQVADQVIVNKTDLVSAQDCQEINRTIREINPLAVISETTQAQVNTAAILSPQLHSLIEKRQISGELTKCGEGNYVASSHKSTQPVSQKQLDQFIASLNTNILRLKGYLNFDDGRCMVLQYVPGQLEILESKPFTKQTELISIGFEAPDFALLNH